MAEIEREVGAATHAVGNVNPEPRRAAVVTTFLIPRYFARIGGGRNAPLCVMERELLWFWSTLTPEFASDEIGFSAQDRQAPSRWTRSPFPLSRSLGLVRCVFGPLDEAARALMAITFPAWTCSRAWREGPQSSTIFPP
jgi:hypothetical protein